MAKALTREMLRFKADRLGYHGRNMCIESRLSSGRSSHSFSNRGSSEDIDF